MKLRNNYPLLTSVLKMSAIGGNGLCLHRAVAFVLDEPLATLCVGTFDGKGGASDPMIHAWAEVGRAHAFAPTLIETIGMTLMDRESYYQVNNARDIHRMARGPLRKLAGRHGWIEHFTTRQPIQDGTSFGEVLLEAMGVEHHLNETLGLVPGRKD